MQDKLLKDWIAAVVGDDSKGFCKFCKCNIKAKYQDLKHHKKTKKHISACPFKNRTLDLFVKLGWNKTSPLEGNIALFLCCHSAISNCDHLVDMFKNKVCDSKILIITNMKMHRTKCRNIIKTTLCSHFEADFRKDIGKSNFSLLIDESNNISVLNLLGISIIHYSNMHKKVVSTYLELAKIEECDAVTLFWQ